MYEREEKKENFLVRSLTEKKVCQRKEKTAVRYTSEV